MVAKQLAIILNSEQVQYIFDCSEKYISALYTLGHEYKQTNLSKESKHPIKFLFGKVLIELDYSSGWDGPWEDTWDWLSLVTNKTVDEQIISDCKRIIAKRRNSGLCQNCGGSFKGIFNKVCSKCGKSKDY